MATRPTRIIDAHVHLWDPANTDWYPYLSGGMALELGDVKGMSRRFDVSTYREESAGWNVVALVNVAAAVGAQSVDEALAVAAEAEASTHGQPAVVVGGITPTLTVPEVIAQIDRQMAAPRFRGVRPMGQTPDPVPHPDVLRALADRGLALDLMAHAHQLAAAADALAAVDGLTVVVEHTGWPRSSTDEEHALWRDGLAALAGLGDRVVCKLSGLAMPLGSMSADAFAPWIGFALDTFGPSRCLIASNFPVDGLHGSLDQLFSTYAEATAHLDDAAHDAVWAGTAERVYRIPA